MELSNPGLRFNTASSSSSRPRSPFAVLSGSWTDGSPSLDSPGASRVKNPTSDSITLWIRPADAFSVAGSVGGRLTTDAICPGGGASNAVLGSANGFTSPFKRVWSRGDTSGIVGPGLAPAGVSGVSSNPSQMRPPLRFHRIATMRSNKPKKRTPSIVLPCRT